jgi:hypothetical protein
MHVSRQIMTQINSLTCVANRLQKAASQSSCNDIYKSSAVQSDSLHFSIQRVGNKDNNKHVELKPKTKGLKPAHSQQLTQQLKGFKPAQGEKPKLEFHGMSHILFPKSTLSLSVSLSLVVCVCSFGFVVVYSLSPSHDTHTYTHQVIHHWETTTLMLLVSTWRHSVDVYMYVRKYVYTDVCIRTHTHTHCMHILFTRKRYTHTHTHTTLHS